MCGINGVFAYRESAPRVDEAELVRVRDAMVRRGPDGSGLWISPDHSVGLGHRRLSIIDLSSSGAQPMSTAGGRFYITFNGEIYNYKELRRELEGKGYVFRTQSDTEVLLHLYADRGVHMVHALRGMYAFGIWDEGEQALFLARDPFGIKPLYYADDGASLRFASQVRSLLKGGNVDTAPEPAGSVGFLIWGAVPEPHTLHRGIRALPAGCYLVQRRGSNAVVKEHFSIRDEFLRAQESRAQLPARREILAEALRDSIRHHMVADVPVGVFLSAGLDSSIVTALALRESSLPVQAITLGFNEYRGTENDEAPLAAQVAKRFGARHAVSTISREDFEAEFDDLLAAMDQPSTDGVNTYFVSRAAAQAGLKVALSGLGGDELFGGYPSFRHVPWLASPLLFGGRLLGLGRACRAISAPLVKAITSPKYASLFEYGGSYAGAYLLRRGLFVPWELEDILDPATVSAGLSQLQLVPSLEETIRGVRGSRSRVAALEMAWYMRNQLLRDADWAGMAHSLEIRVPLVDVALFRSIAPLLVADDPPSKSEAVATLETPLPDDVLHREKTGFSTPVRDWIAAREPSKNLPRGLRGWAMQVLPPQPKTFRALVLVTDAFGGNGGIAKFNRDFLTAMAGMPECAEVVALPRLVETPVSQLPRHLTFVEKSAGSKLAYVWHALSHALDSHFDLVVAGHINVASLGVALSGIARARAMLVVHGIDAWTAHRSLFVRRSLPKYDRIIGVSQLTLDRLSSWSSIERSRMQVLPNCVDLRKFKPGPKPADLTKALQVEGKTVLMTVGRLSTQERYKGFDEVIEALPALVERIPNVMYVICGDGPDRARLERKADDLGVRDRVAFAGFIDEARKADYYRMADAYVMPSRGEGFGIVFLEAMACGLPAIGSKADGSQEALRHGALGTVVDPNSKPELIAAIEQAIRNGRGVPKGLDDFSSERFSARLQAIANECWETPVAH